MPADKHKAWRLAPLKQGVRAAAIKPEMLRGDTGELDPACEVTLLLYFPMKTHKDEQTYI